jgi:isoleucyl-tRNA synthetase
VILTVSNEQLAERLRSYTELKDVLIVSAVEVAVGELPENLGMRVTVEKAQGNKCERCWCISEEVGKIALHPTLCKRCASVVD